MKKITNQLLLATLLIIQVSSCSKKDSPATVTGSVVGFWAGSASDGSPASILFRSNGTMRLYDASSASDTAALPDGNKVDGNYTLTGASVKGSTSVAQGSTVVTVNIAATVNSNFTSMTGTTGLAPNSTGISSFTITKQ
jgi:hypothetical protein